MIDAVEYLVNSASGAEIAEHLLCCDANFVPTLSERVVIPDYAQKIAGKAARFEAWSNGRLIGLVAIYCNDLETRYAHITSVSVMNQWTGEGIAAQLMNLCIRHAKTAGMHQISLEVATGNMPAIKLYEKSGFIAGMVNEPFISMKLNLGSK